MAVVNAVKYLWTIQTLLLLLAADFTAAQVVIKNCPGNEYSTNGEAWWPMPTAEVTGDIMAEVTCTHPSTSTLYKAYQTRITCTAADQDGNTDSCTFSVFTPDGLACDKKGGTPHCICLAYRPYFDPCHCEDGYSGLDCQDQDGSGCSPSSPACTCTGATCSCADEGYKGKACDFDYQPPDMTCPEDVFVADMTATVPLPGSVIATDNDGTAVSVVCDPPLGSTVHSSGNTTIIPVVCMGRDTAGNRADCSFRVVLDVEPPKIPFCPGTVHTNNSSYSWSLALAVDDSHPQLDVTCDPQPGSTLTAQHTVVMCSAQDWAGNAVQENCTFSIYLDAASCSPGMPNCECEANNCWCQEGFSGLNCTVEDAGTCVSTGNPGHGCLCNATAGCVCTEGFKGASCEIDFHPPMMTNCPFGEIWSFDPVVTYRPIWTSDNSDEDEQPMSAVTCYPEEGSSFYQYNTPVTCSAQDPSGNKVDSCNFPVRRNSASGCTGDGDNCYNCASRCRCLPGYYGPNCQVCGSCNNGGTREQGECQCQCPMLHHGLICNECYEPNPDHCFNGGVFISDSCSCECQGDWTGRHCEQKHAEDCLGETNAGCSCNGTMCSCNEGFQGPQCETCKPCQNGGTQQDSTTCSCQCQGHYLPPLCSECDVTATCENGGTLDSSTCMCLCADGWTGSDCNQTMTFDLKCPADIIRGPDPSKTSARVTWADPREAGAVVQCTPSSGSEFPPEGSTAVQCTAQDTATSVTSYCSFNVLIDSRAPLVTCPSDITAYHPRWQTDSPISWSPVTAKDEVSGTVPASCIPASGSLFSGETTVVCTAMDQAMNVDSCMFVAGVYYRGNTLRFPTTMSCAKCYEDNPDGKCSYNTDEDEYECYCPSGFTQDTDGKCQDIDECLDEGLCDPNAQCQNTDGSYQCECLDGFYGSGKMCREYPHTLYPDIPEQAMNTWERKVAIDVALASDSMYGCDGSQEPMSAECMVLMETFRKLVSELYFQPALLRIEMDQSHLGERRIPHVVVYDYNRLGVEQRALTAKELYDSTMGASIESGDIGGLKLASSCSSCEPPKDMTNMCGADPRPDCGEGYMLAEVLGTDDTSCYLTCESLCTTDYCGAGICTHNPPFDPECRCPSHTEGPRCDPIPTTTDGSDIEEPVAQLNIAVIVGCSVAGGVLLIVILVVLAYVTTSKNSKKKSAAKEAKGRSNDSFVMEACS